MLPSAHRVQRGDMIPCTNLSRQCNSPLSPPEKSIFAQRLQKILQLQHTVDHLNHLIKVARKTHSGIGIHVFLLYSFCRAAVISVEMHLRFARMLVPSLRFSL